MKLVLAIAALLLAPMAALANGAVVQSGPVTSNHAPVWYGNGVMGDGGTPSAPALNSLGLFNGANCPFGVSSATSAGAPTTAYGLFTICQTPTATILKVAGIGETSPNLYFEINGVDYPFDGGGGGGGNPVTVTPSSVTIATAMTWQSLALAGPRNGCVYTNNSSDIVYVLEESVSGVATTPEINASTWLQPGDAYICVPYSNNALSITSASVNNAGGSYKVW